MIMIHFWNKDVFFTIQIGGQISKRILVNVKFSQIIIIHDCISRWVSFDVHFIIIYLHFNSIAKLKSKRSFKWYVPITAKELLSNATSALLH